MPIDILQIQEFQKLFTGAQHHFGEYTYLTTKDGLKLKGHAKTIRNKLITIEDYERHLNGEKGLGIIPINENGFCSFSAIDIDIYNTDLKPYIRAIEKGGFPLVPFQSKSGGLHIYIFFKEPEPAKKVIELLRKFSSILAIDLLVKNKGEKKVEIFPKQTKIEPGGVGNWINLPYYKSETTIQFAHHNNKQLSLKDALIYAKEKRTTLKQAEEFLASLDYNDAPPCLQQIYFLSPDSNRNEFLFSMGIYLKKKDPEFFDQSLIEVNQNLSDPLPENEVQKTVIQSLKKKDYNYKCKESPCVDFCNKTECKKREFGIGKNEGYFSSVEMVQLYQYKCREPYYEWEVKLQGQENATRLRFKNEDEIIKQDVFIKLCMQNLYELPNKIKQVEWFRRVNQALKEIKVIDIEKEDDTSPFAMLKSSIVDFLTGRAKAETKEQILAKRVYKENDEYLFRVKDLTEYVYTERRFNYFKPQELHGILRELNFIPKKIYTEAGKQIRVSALREEDLQDVMNHNLKPNFKDHIEEDF